MKKKIIVTNVIIVVFALLVLFLSGISITKSIYKKQAEERIIDVANIYAENYTSFDKVVKNVPKDYRVTVVDKSGKVLSDSETADVSNMENHIDREEIVAALHGKPVAVTRRSDTTNKDMVYSAVKVNLSSDDYVFVRVSTPVDSVNLYATSTILPNFYVLIAAIIAAVILSIVLTKSLVKPMAEIKNSLIALNNGTFTTPSTPSEKDPEINKMMSEINDIGEKLSDTITTVSEDNKKLDYILNNVSDGIVVITADGNIEIMNDNAKLVFDVKNDAISSNYTVLSANEKFISAVSDAVNERINKVFEFTTAAHDVYLTSIRCLDGGMTIIVLSDITAVKQGEEIRSEFFANASHELKTPLTAIKGFNDVIGMKSKDDDIRTLSSKIDKEVNRVVSLIDDMLNLSKLETTKTPIVEKVDLVAVAYDAAESISALARGKNVNIEISGEGTVDMEKDHAYELVKNLMENAVRYNEDGGHVIVSVDEKADKVTLKVKDDGIGIDEENQSRIFERFYRVNKSRSRETGGTGLGLSIVKHVAELYGAKLTLSSTLGAGTEITVSFKK
ncbi:MAG: ATP-binding protein [Clostridiales bacterium]|nr:ATP-binding protein [Clostridiales bacterium]MDD7054367.1 ATP-binding protein [Clostridiales bacterium]MDY5190484.1 ATP-binding protein [Eubacteriales bacterium]